MLAQPTMRLPLTQRLSFRQMQYVVLLAFALGLLFSILQISLDYLDAKSRFDITTQQTLDIVKEPASQAVYTFDEDLAEQVVKGLFNYGLIYQVAVIDEENVTLAQRERPTAEAQNRWISEVFFGGNRLYAIPLYVEGEASERVFGTLHVSVDTHLLAKSFSDRVVVVIFSGFVRNFLLAGILLLLFHHMVTRPIVKLSQSLNEIDPQNPAKTSLALSRFHRQDELGQLVTRTNALLCSVAEKVQEIKTINEGLEQRVKARTQELALANQEISFLNKRLEAENVRMGAELEVTRQLQQMVLPTESELSQIEPLDIACFMQPATEVGGDYYDILGHENGRVKIGIGDVIGHGLASGVFMLMVQTAVRTLLENKVSDATMFLDVLNRTIYNNTKRMKSDKIMTLALLDYQDGVVTLSGQHEEVLIVRRGGTVERIDTIDLGYFIGLEMDIAHLVDALEIKLASGDGLVLYTDGITEARCSQGQMYGMERLCKVLSQHWDNSAQFVQQRVLNDVEAHVGNHKQIDDWTLVILKQR